MRYDVLHGGSAGGRRRAGTETEPERLPEASQGGRDPGGEGAGASRRRAGAGRREGDDPRPPHRRGPSHRGRRGSPRARPAPGQAPGAPGPPSSPPAPSRARVSLVYLDSSAVGEVGV